MHEDLHWEKTKTKNKKRVLSTLSHTETVGSMFRIEIQTNISGVLCWKQIRVVKDTRDINPGCYSMVRK